jgi:exodeoxyribonuclease VII small subunit
MSDSRPASDPQTTAEPQTASEPQARTEHRAPADPQAPAGAQPQTYESASARVEEIIRRLDSGEASLNETLELVGEGKALIELCARELEAVSGALEELRLDELVARLEGEVSTK